MKRVRNYQRGFSVIEALLILVITGIISFTGWYVWNAKQNTDKSLAPNNSTAPLMKKKSATIQSNTHASEQVTPTGFVNSLLGDLASGNEIRLDADLAPSFASYRKNNLAHLSCEGKTITNPMVLFCGSLLNPTHIKVLTPKVIDYTFTNGQQGKSVTYQETQTTGDTGTTYYSFKLVVAKNSWKLNDYVDLFVGTGSPVPKPLLGIQESGT